MLLWLGEATLPVTPSCSRLASARTPISAPTWREFAVALAERGRSRPASTSSKPRRFCSRPAPTRRSSFASSTSAVGHRRVRRADRESRHGAGAGAGAAGGIEHDRRHLACRRERTPAPEAANRPQRRVGVRALLADSGAHESACGKGALPMQRCRHLPADTAPVRALGSSEAIARLGWP